MMHLPWGKISAPRGIGIVSIRIGILVSDPSPLKNTFLPAPPLPNPILRKPKWTLMSKSFFQLWMMSWALLSWASKVRPPLAHPLALQDKSVRMKTMTKLAVMLIGSILLLHTSTLMKGMQFFWDSCPAWRPSRHPLELALVCVYDLFTIEISKKFLQVTWVSF